MKPDKNTLYASYKLPNLNKNAMQEAMRRRFSAKIDIVEEMSSIGKKNDAEQVTIEHDVQLTKNKDEMDENMKKIMKVDTEVAIIGYWKKNYLGEFKCYHYFYIPKPYKRETRKANRKVRADDCSIHIDQVLFHDHHSDNVFFFYEEPCGEEKGMHLGIVNLEVDTKVTYGFEKRNHLQKENVTQLFPIKDEAMKKMVAEYGKHPRILQVTRANPSLIRGFNQNRDESGAEDNYVLVIPTNASNEEYAKSLWFFDLKAGKTIKKIIGGEVFLKYD